MSIAESVQRGWNFTSKNMGSFYAVKTGVSYVGNVDEAITKLAQDINAKNGSLENIASLKGFIAEYWHADTFNINAAAADSVGKATIERSNAMGSVDVSTNYGTDYSMKYYATAADSAKQQATNITQAYHKYLSRSPSDSKMTFDEYKVKNGFVNDYEAVYAGQDRVIPTDQLDGAITFLKQQIAKEQARGGERLELLDGYKETLIKLTDRIKDSNGTESIPLTKAESEAIATVCKSGKFKPEDFGIKLENVITTEYLLQQALKAGYTAAVISLVLQLGPEIFKAIDYLIENGEIDEEQFKRLGFNALSVGAKGFLRGSVASSITIACKSGKLGAQCINMNVAQIGAIVVIAMDALSCAYDVANGNMTRKEMGVQLTKDILISSGALAGGAVGQTVLPMLPVVGYMLGSFVGSVVASFVVNKGEKAILSFCVDGGYTLFGLVEQNYELPTEVMKSLGINLVSLNYIKVNHIAVRHTMINHIAINHIKLNTIDIIVLRRGVLGVTKIGYVM